ncbi:MAG: uncharacterized protein KVP18_003458 [Porospora cf. gigantea A]|uniref:uncharacterized protein n=1 Tax=Porospora cf. gigantea A TaxID=2853593 RepID=UPI00355A9C22|nr:MAG: hypothetical protein KVP18_003458 [Porospora cf. gigantea A]
MARLADKLPDFRKESLEVDPKEVRLGKRRLVRKKHHTSSFLKANSTLDPVPLPKIEPAEVLEAASREILQTLGGYEARLRAQGHVPVNKQRLLLGLDGVYHRMTGLRRPPLAVYLANDLDEDIRKSAAYCDMLGLLEATGTPMFPFFSRNQLKRISSTSMRHSCVAIINCSGCEGALCRLKELWTRRPKSVGVKV